MMAHEIKALLTMKGSRKSKGVTQVIDYGMIVLTNFDNNKTSNDMASFYVMPRYKLSLGQVLRAQSLSKAEVCLLAQYLIESLRTVHSTGRTYNDLKPENIMIT
jgi:serine/threonine protein kinase